MDGPSLRFWPIFFEVYESLPRQGDFANLKMTPLSKF